MKNKGSAILLALFFGGLGMHKFYLGRSGVGILYLLFFWTFIPLILSIIDIIVLLCKSEENFNKEYNSLLMNINNGIVNMNAVNNLEKLNELKEKGLITIEEFEIKRQKVLNQI